MACLGINQRPNTHGPKYQALWNNKRGAEATPPVKTDPLSQCSHATQPSKQPSVQPKPTNCSAQYATFCPTPTIPKTATPGTTRLNYCPRHKKSAFSLLPLLHLSPLKTQRAEDSPPVRMNGLQKPSHHKGSWLPRPLIVALGKGTVTRPEAAKVVDVRRILLINES